MPISISSLVMGNRDASIDDHARLTQGLSDAHDLLLTLERLLREPAGNGPSTGTIGRHAPEGSEPWNNSAAGPYWDLWFGLRRLARTSADSLGLPPPLLGGGIARTLELIGNYAPSLPPQELTTAADRVEGWVIAARRIRDIDEDEPWVPVPRTAGAEPPVCPYCKTLSLRMKRQRQEVKCFFPGCVDYDLNPTRAHMEPSQLADSGMLVFGDGTLVAYRDEVATTGGA